MDVVVVFNGLGNQMSQYAFFLQKKKLNKSTRFIKWGDAHNGFELEKIFGITYESAVGDMFLYTIFRILVTEKLPAITRPLQMILRLFGCKIVKENYNYNFNENWLTPSRGLTFYFGGWPSERYFLPVKTEVLTKFKFKTPEDSFNTDYLRNILRENSVAIHIRRGDYLTAENVNIFGGVCTKEYFDKAIFLIESKIENAHFFVFSNDIEWVKANLVMNKVTYVTCNTGDSSWKDMYLMSMCRHNVISNSTFSWWAAWLNTKKDRIVISPSRYLNQDKTTDVYPEDWIKLSDY